MEIAAGGTAALDLLHADATRFAFTGVPHGRNIESGQLLPTLGNVPRQP